MNSKPRKIQAFVSYVVWNQIIHVSEHYKVSVSFAIGYILRAGLREIRKRDSAIGKELAERHSILMRAGIDAARELATQEVDKVMAAGETVEVE